MHERIVISNDRCRLMPIICFDDISIMQEILFCNELFTCELASCARIQASWHLAIPDLHFGVGSMVRLVWADAPRVQKKDPRRWGPSSRMKRLGEGNVHIRSFANAS